MSANYTYLSNAHPEFIESLYHAYQQNPQSVDVQWQKFFEGFDFALANAITTPTNGNGNGTQKSVATNATTTTQSLSFDLRVYQLIAAHRHKGHLEAVTNPLKPRKDRKAHLSLSDFGFTNADLTTETNLGVEIGLQGKQTLETVYQQLRKIYCGTLGFECEYITNLEALQWLRQRIETQGGSFGFSLNERKHIFRKLNATVVFEQFLHTKYIGQKRFGLEGGESMIPGLDAAINAASNLDVSEVLIGMAHRGRLNVLANIIGKTYEQIFNEFEGYAAMDHKMGSGDVKYHLGYSAQHTAPNGQQLYLKLMPNPSHLEAVNPVVQGFARAKADILYNSNYDKVLPILIHGDAAVAGQGIVYEVTQMCGLKGYYTGGALHFVINNQVGFTTDFDDARTADYCTSVASMVKAPVIHVNGDDIEAVVFACQLAVQYRQKFNADVFVDMVCYRKHGHNESDDPTYTQPGLYKLIENHPNPREIYAQKLYAETTFNNDDVKALNDEFWQLLQDRLNMVKQKPLPYQLQKPDLAWQKLRHAPPTDLAQPVITGIEAGIANQIAKQIDAIPENFDPLPKINTMLRKRRENFQKTQTLDWGGAELLAYGSLLAEGFNVRMSGQDVKRGTFSHRHAMLYDANTYNEYCRLSQVVPNQQGQFLIYNSLLSEYAVLGFEYGYALAWPNALTIWEAQFGDFANGAQIIIDQFIASSEAKWTNATGLVLLLPHGYEGQGPEHSSARLERFLQLCGNDNMFVTNITTPANFFHALRRQVISPFRKPLVVMSPKSLLREPLCTSHIDEVTGNNKRFLEIIDDTNLNNPEKIKTVLLCSGKIYYDLLRKQQTDQRKDIAIVRIEQLYPFAEAQFKNIISRYPKKARLIWVQEEPANMGALWYLRNLFAELNLDMAFIARPNSASPASGFKAISDAEQKAIVEQAFA